MRGSIIQLSSLSLPRAAERGVDINVLFFIRDVVWKEGPMKQRAVLYHRHQVPQ